MDLTLLAVLAAGGAFAQVNIHETDRFAWSENAGWQNWRPTDGGVTVVKNGANGYLYGCAWGENVGWIKLGAGMGPYANTSSSNYGVNMDAAGQLSGYAWSETCGWINFCPTNGFVTNRVSIAAFSLDGYAWAENVGWVHFKNESPAYNVRYVPSGTVVLIY